MKQRYHVRLGPKRTTVSLPDTLAGLLAVKLNQRPETKEAHRAICSWLQQTLDDLNDPGRSSVSRWLQSEATLFITDKMLSKKYLNMMFSD